MTTEVICALIAFVGVLSSALISYAISRSTANKEIEKMELVWAREDVVSSDDEFAEMAGAVARFVNVKSGVSQRSAIQKVAAVRSKEAGALGRLLDELYIDIHSGDTCNADIHLSQVIDQKRESKCKTNAHKRDNPKK